MINQVTNSEWVEFLIYTNKGRVKDDNVEKALFFLYVDSVVYDSEDTLSAVRGLNVLRDKSGTFYMKETVMAQRADFWQFMLSAKYDFVHEYDEIISRVDSSPERSLRILRLQEAIRAAA